MGPKSGRWPRAHLLHRLQAWGTKEMSREAIGLSKELWEWTKVGSFILPTLGSDEVPGVFVAIPGPSVVDLF